MLESGTIVQIHEKTMTVEFERNSMCEKCGACEHAQKAMLMEVERIGNASLGDKVQVSLPERTLLRAALLAYGVPLVLLLAGLAAGYALPGALGFPGNPDLYAVALGLVLAGGGYLVIHLTEKKRKASAKYAPKVVHLERMCQKSCRGSQDNE